MKLLVLFCVALQFFVANSQKKPLSVFPQPCRRSDPNIKTCFLKAADRLASSISSGLPELDIPSADPLEVPFAVFNRSVNGLLNVNAVLKNVKVLGLSQISIDDFQADFEKYAGEFKGSLPHVYASLEYKVAGEILGTPFTSQGYLTANFTDIKGHITADFKPYKKEGVQYFGLENMKMEIKVGHGHIQLTAKNPQNQPMADFITNYFNQHDKQILDLANSVYTDIIEENVRDLINRQFSRIPAETFIID